MCISRRAWYMHAPTDFRSSDLHFCRASTFPAGMIATLKNCSITHFPCVSSFADSLSSRFILAAHQIFQDQASRYIHHNFTTSIRQDTHTPWPPSKPRPCLPLTHSPPYYAGTAQHQSRSLARGPRALPSPSWPTVLTSCPRTRTST